LRDELPRETPPHEDATSTTALWELRARKAASQQHFELAAVQYEITLALRSRRYEAAIPLAEEIEALGETRHSGELLAAASRLEPRSTWLFATYMRWLIAHEQAHTALTALAARPIDKRWTASERDTLRASALEQRASGRMAHSPAQATADLTSALELAPANPWIRYRLAQLHARSGDRDTGRQLMSDGVREYSRSNEIRYAQALYLAGIDDDTGALAAVASISDTERTAGMHELSDRLQVSLARNRATQLRIAGDIPAAREALLAVEPLARHRFELSRELAFSWMSLGDKAHGLALVAPFVAAPGDNKDTLLGWAELLDSAQEDEQLDTALNTLLTLDSLTTEERTRIAALRRSLDLRDIERLERSGDRVAAARALDALLTHAPDDRQLLIARADLDLRMARPQAARDRYATLVAEQPDDLDTRLSLARALTESGDTALARVQVQAVQDRLPADDIELRISVARRQSALGEHADAAITLDVVLERAPDRTDALMLAADVQRSLGNYDRAREYLVRAEQNPDIESARTARASLSAIDSRRRGSMTAATELRSKPGGSGISQFESQLLTTTWRYPTSYTNELLLHTDAVALDAGKLSGDYDTAALLGTLQTAGPSATRRFTNDRQLGVSLGTGYTMETLAFDVGTTPVGFTLNNIVGGLEWTPRWRDVDLTLRMARRAVTSSVLSYGGLQDPITGKTWGGVVATGPSVIAGLYGERFSISGSLKITELTGSNVLDNRFMGLRGSTDWQFLSRTDTRAYAGLTLNYWNYEKNLGGYTFGHGGYYSPQSYLSVALPVELQGRYGEWSYRLRASISQSTSQLDRSPFYPTAPALQAAASSSPLPAGFDAPFYEASRGSGLSVSAYAAIERQVFGNYVVGGVLDLDRSDFYKPTVAMLYLRRRFGPEPLEVAVPPRPVRPYNDD
jgi:tetratricopeptide (TPR) repeat protein